MITAKPSRWPKESALMISSFSTPSWTRTVATFTSTIATVWVLHIFYQRFEANLRDSSGVQPVGNIETYSGYSTVTATGSVTAISRYTGQITGTPTAWDDLPDATDITSWTPIAIPTTAPLANGTRLDCEEYEDNAYGSIPCNWLASGASTLDFANWNPSVEFYNCTLTNNTRYCTLLGDGYDLGQVRVNETKPYADTPSNAAPNATTACYSWYDTGNGKFFSFDVIFRLSHYWYDVCRNCMQYYSCVRGHHYRRVLRLECKIFSKSTLI